MWRLAVHLSWALLGLALGVGLVWLVLLRGDGGARAQQPVPAHLAILSANIIEQSADPTKVSERQLVLRLEVAAAPRCTSATAFLAYGLLIDADKDAATGLTGPAFEGLGVDARLSAQCDPVAGRLLSPLGPVNVTTDQATGVVRIEIRTTVDQLPSIDFLWVAFAQEGSTFSRLPKEPEVGAWTTFERSLY